MTITTPAPRRAIDLDPDVSITQSALPVGVAVTSAPPYPADRAAQLVAAAQQAAHAIRARLS
ncbi:MAG TPA: hypothetical protein VGI56_03945 [Galbitalea sp.]|jgi:hypothetical protein